MVVAEPKIRLVLDFSLVRRCTSPRQLASSMSTRHVENIHERQFHVPVQPLASEPSQTVVRIHHLDRDRVIIANQIITHTHPILSESCNVFMILDPLCPRSAVGHQFSHSERIGEFRVGHDKLGLLQPSNGETNPSNSSGVTEAHLPRSDLLRLMIIKYHLILLSYTFCRQVRPTDYPECKSASLFVPSHTAQRASSALSCSPYDVETAHHEHLANYAFHDATDHVSPGLATITLACPPAVRLRNIRVDPNRVPLDSHCGLRSFAQGLRVSPHNAKIAC